MVVICLYVDKENSLSLFLYKRKFICEILLNCLSFKIASGKYKRHFKLEWKKFQYFACYHFV